MPIMIGVRPANNACRHEPRAAQIFLFPFRHLDGDDRRAIAVWRPFAEPDYLFHGNRKVRRLVRRRVGGNWWSSSGCSGCFSGLALGPQGVGVWWQWGRRRVTMATMIVMCFSGLFMVSQVRRSRIGEASPAAHGASSALATSAVCLQVGRLVADESSADDRP